MSAREPKPWWERAGHVAPPQTPVEAKREHLRAELARAWGAAPESAVARNDSPPDPARAA